MGNPSDLYQYGQFQMFIAAKLAGVVEACNYCPFYDADAPEENQCNCQKNEPCVIWRNLHAAFFDGFPTD